MENRTSSVLPPGFRFHPTDEELIVYYLCNQASSRPCPASIIPEVDIYKFDPWELPGNQTFVLIKKFNSLGWLECVSYIANTVTQFFYFWQIKKKIKPVWILSIFEYVEPYNMFHVHVSLVLTCWLLMKYR